MKKQLLQSFLGFLLLFSVSVFAQPGMTCADPIVITSIPFQETNNTINFSDTVDLGQGGSCGAVPVSTDYIAGRDVFYSYTPTEDGVININMKPLNATSTNSGIFVYDGCIGVGDVCVGGEANTTINTRNFDINVQVGHTYIILISSTGSAIAYALAVQMEGCSEVPSALSVSNVTPTSADLHWSSSPGTNSWEVAVQPSGSPVPSGNGVMVSEDSYTPVLNPGTNYQFWVRAECVASPGQFAVWAGPYLFVTPVCEPVETCVYTFKLSNAVSGGWGTTRMQVRQNGAVMATIGAGVNGPTPIDVTVPLCDGVPFDLYWSVAGSNPQHTIVKILNAFGQTLYMKPAGTGAVNEVLYSGVADCAAADCYLPPINPSVSGITTTSAVLTWEPNYPGSTQFQILKIAGPNPPSQFPDNSVAASYPVITTPNGGPYTFTATNLQPATIYYMYVRAVCASGTTEWVPFSSVNTVACMDSEKCNYRFVLTSAAFFNAWTTATMQVRQNGIVVATLDASQANVPGGVTVPLCENVPFDLYWDAQGTQPLQMGILIQDPFQEIIYSKPAGSGLPLTVLHSSTVNCTPPSCPQPTNLNAASITDTSAVFSWTQTGDASQWEVYLAPTGAPMPVNGTPIINTGLYHVTSTNSYNATGLSPLTNYTYYVRAICTGDDIGNWTIANPKSFSTVFGSDHCELATPIPVTTMENTEFITASTAYASTSWPQPQAGCTGADDDVWFSFVAASDKALLKYKLLSAVSADVRYILYTGSCTGTPSACEVLKTKLLTGLTAGETYYLRVFTANTSPQFASFQLAIQSPLVTNDECINAIQVPVNPSLAIAEFISCSTAGATMSMPEPACNGADDDVWFSFVATESTHYLKINEKGGTASNLRYAVYSGGCEGLTQLYCSNNDAIAVSELIAGQSYLVRVFTVGTLSLFEYADFDISITTAPELVNDEPTNATLITVNPSSTCDQIYYGSVTGATASPQPNCGVMNDVEDSDDVWFVFTATSKELQITVDEFGLTPVLFAAYSGTPDNLTQIYCGLSYGIFNNYVVGQQYYLRLWEYSGTPRPSAFSICIKTISTCETAASFCGSTVNDPYIFPNTIYVANTAPVACLESAPNAVFYNLRISESGPVTLNIVQNTAFDDNGNAVGENLDVDFVAWGPFSDSFSSCDEIQFEDCPSCPNNTNNQLFYPFGNIVDCSYSNTSSEVFNIPDAIAGEHYVVMITNFNGDPGFIKLTQTNFGYPGSGRTACNDKIKLIAFIDLNNNGIKDLNEMNFTEGNFVYQKNNAGPLHHITTTHGVYEMYDLDPSDSYDFSFEVHPEYTANFTAVTATYNNVSLVAGSQIFYFPVTITQEYDEVSVTIVPSSSPLTGGQYTNKIIYKNEGINTVSGTITFQKDPALAISTINQSGTVSNANGFVYNFTNLEPFQTRIITVNMTVPSIPVVNLGDLITNTADITIADNDIFPGNNHAAVAQEILGSYDPNDKMESHGGNIGINELDEDGYLYYTIRFQNTGTYYANDIRLVDVLDAMLDETSIRTIKASHDYTMERIGNQIVWRFTDVNLPAEIQDEANSQGYVTFKIKPKSGYAIGDIISNTAEIYFDTNPAIVTNTVETEVSTPLGTDVFDISNIVLYPNPANTIVYLNLQHTTESLEQVTLYDVLGKSVKQVKTGNPRETAVDVSGLAKGVYMVEIKTKSNLRLVKKLVIN